MDGLAESAAGLDIDLGEMVDVDAMAEAVVAAADAAIDDVAAEPAPETPAEG